MGVTVFAVMAVVTGGLVVDNWLTRRALIKLTQELHSINYLPGRLSDALEGMATSFDMLRKTIADERLDDSDTE